jgi:NADH:ubiquinone oxidoreductase subunit H
MAEGFVIHELIFDGVRSLADAALTGTPLESYAGSLAVITATMISCVAILGVFMLSMFVILWLERKVWARMMDRRGATMDWRSLWVGEQGVTAGEWWKMLPFGIGTPIGALNRWLNRVMGNESEHATVDRVGNRSWFGAWWALPGFIQNIADGMKFLTKEHMVPNRADKIIYELAPFLIITSTVVIIGFMPFSAGLYAINPELSVLFAFAIFGIAPIGVFFAGWASNNKYTLLGGIRSAAQLTAYEIPLLITVLGVCVVTGTFNFVELGEFQHSSGSWNIFLMPLSAGLFLITMIAEVERIPFDMPEAEAELVEGWWTEYGGMRWGLLFAAEYMRVWAACIMFSVMFLGGWNAPLAGTFSTIPVFGALWSMPGVLWTLLKAWATFLIFVIARAALHRIRTDQILEFGWRYLLPLSMFQLAVAFVLRLKFFNAENIDSSAAGGSAWDGGTGFAWTIPLIITLVSLIVFTVYIKDVDKDPPGRPYHVYTTEPAGTHLAGKE